MMLIYMIRVLFVLFFVYTVIYLFQMGISLCISIYRLEKYKKNKTLNRELFPTAFAKRIPVSVIIPAYNEAACITETIEALFEEDYPNLEIIVVDDGSNDNTESLVVKRFGLIEEPVLSESESCSFFLPPASEIFLIVLSSVFSYNILFLNIKWM